MPTRIQVRRGTAAEWTTANPVLASGELGFETDTGRAKYGNGVTAWTSLAYQTVAQSQVTNLTSDLAAKAALASPTFTGTPAAPTASVGTDTTQIATTSFVNAEINSDAVLKSLVDVAGDLLVGSANDTVSRLPLGADGQVLTVNAAGTGVNKVAWTTLGGGTIGLDSVFLLMGA